MCLPLLNMYLPCSGNTDSLRKKKICLQLSVNKVMLTVFQDMKGPIMIGFLEKD